MEPARKRIPISEIDPRQALHELQVYHEELESRNNQLLEIRKQNEALIQKYTTLYNQSPSGYITLNSKGVILELNSTAVLILGQSQEELINSDFNKFISKESRPAFDEFFLDIFEKMHKVSCEAVLCVQSPLNIYFEGISTHDGQNCFITMVDISVLKKTEEALNLSRKEFQSYFENSSVGMTVSSPGKGYIEINHKFCQMLGYTKDELIGINWVDLSHPDDLPANLNYYRQTLEGKIDRYQMDKRLIRKDGQVLYVTLVVACQRNEDRTIHHFLCSYIDITEHKLLRKALRQSEEKYRTLLEFAPDAFFHGDDLGNFIMVNNKAVEFTGYTREELLSMNISELFSEDVLNRKPLRFDLLTDGKVITTEREITRKDGQQIYVEMTSRKMPDGTLQCLMNDITARKIGEDALKESEERFRSIFEDSPDAILIADAKSGIIINANHSAEKLFLWKISDFTGMHHLLLHPREEHEQITHSFEKWSKKTEVKGPNPPVERTVIRADGKRIPVEIISKVIILNGKPVIYGKFRDISKRKQADAALRESEERFRVLFENSPDSIFIADIETGLIMDCNQAACKLTGKTKDEIIGMPQCDLHPKETFSATVFRNDVEKLKKSSLISPIEIMVLKTDGTQIPVEILASITNYNGKKVVQGIFRDLSFRKHRII